MYRTVIIIQFINIKKEKNYRTTC